jgi:hypothetical protein
MKNTPLGCALCSACAVIVNCEAVIYALLGPFCFLKGRIAPKLFSEQQ